MKFLYLSASLVLAATTMDCIDWNFTQVMVKPGLQHHEYKIANVAEGDFMKLIEISTIWLDKSLLIKTMWEDENDIFVVTGPPRWGKTINLKMIMEYHELNCNEDGSPATYKNNTKAYQYFVEGRITPEKDTAYQLQHAPLITGYKNNIHLGAYPVVYLSGTGLVIELGLDTFRDMILKTYQPHYRLYRYMNSKKNDYPDIITDIQEFEGFYKSELIETKSLAELGGAIEVLCRLLHKYYGQRVIILYDEFDAYVHKAYFGRINDAVFAENFRERADFTQALQIFIRVTFKENQHIAKAFITGVLSAYETSFLSGANNVLFVHVFSNSDFFPFYGIFGPEFKQFADKLKWNESHTANVTHYYEGYRSLSHLDVPLYSTYSLRGCISTGEIRNYWTEATRHNFLSELFDQWHLQTKLVSLIRSFGSDEALPVSIDSVKFPRMLLDDCESIHQLTVKNEQYHEYKHKDAIFATLLYAGIVSIHPTNKTNADTLYLRIPNLEIYEYLTWLWVTKLGVGIEIFTETELPILNYLMSDDDPHTLPLMTEQIARNLFHDAGRQPFGHATTLSKNKYPDVHDLFSNCMLGNEKTIETLLKVMFHSALRFIHLDVKSAEQMGRSSKSISPHYLDLMFILRNTTAVIIEIKYKGYRDKSYDITEAFNQSVSYSMFYRELNITLVKFYKFLAVGVTEDLQVDTRGVTVSSSDLAEMMATSETIMSNSLKKDYATWRTSINEEMAMRHKSKIIQSTYSLL